MLKFCLYFKIVFTYYSLMLLTLNGKHNGENMIFIAVVALVNIIVAFLFTVSLVNISVDHWPCL